VHNHGHRGSGRRPHTPAIAPDADPAAFERALRWRGEWRAEIAGDFPTNGSAANESAERPNKARFKKKADHDRARFAAAIARAEFGRFYWDKRHNQPQEKKVKDRPGRGKR
jgi:hypothetical protein